MRRIFTPGYEKARMENVWWFRDAAEERVTTITQTIWRTFKLREMFGQAVESDNYGYLGVLHRESEWFPISISYWCWWFSLVLKLPIGSSLLNFSNWSTCVHFINKHQAEEKWIPWVKEIYVIFLFVCIHVTSVSGFWRNPIPKWPQSL